ncbi:MarR family transcriptional regulator [Gordonia sp. L191]|uniref:MarR family winged helix-turn-helix transcriptional regulator n=1 Tax=Gordonia TaxID=2053 RepID=UPI001AD78DAE|nr:MULTISPECIES: MarR family transcriptional regulator [Gordonia]QTI70213.1 MarR family transcriptional regulator [Gordonia polyisoprenivorans]WHU46237.1 MarR family transcriptional regulator [Gordonia sp. L191]
MSEHDTDTSTIDSLVDDVWQAMITLVFDSRDPWRRDVVAATGLPFSRIRVLRRVAQGPTPLKELARAATMDPPAVSVAVSDLESAGYVVRKVTEQDRRCKYVHLTDAGRAVLDVVAAVPDPAPPQLRSLDADQLRRLSAALGQGVEPAAPA